MTLRITTVLETSRVIESSPPQIQTADCVR
jgi:hypothetical protein